MKNRITIRRSRRTRGRHARVVPRGVVVRRMLMAGVAAVAAATTTVGATTGVFQLTASEAKVVPRRVTPVGDLPPGASVSRETTPPGVLMVAVKAHQRRVTAHQRRVQAHQRRVKAARLARQRAARAAARDAARDPRAVARSMTAARYGWGAGQFSCLSLLWQRESGWNPHAANPSSSAYGIPQALPGSKMATKGADWRTNPVTQISWGLSYIKASYGSPCGAWAHSQASGWY